MKKITVLTLIAFTLSLVSSCYYDKEETLYPNSSTNTSCDTSLAKYSKDVSVIINSKCAVSGCHVAGSQTPDLSSYAALTSSNNITRVQERAINSKTMPAAGPLSACEITKLQLWINNGAKND